jgi:hypothetical protein
MDKEIDDFFNNVADKKKADKEKMKAVNAKHTQDIKAFNEQFKDLFYKQAFPVMEDFMNGFRKTFMTANFITGNGSLVKDLNSKAGMNMLAEGYYFRKDLHQELRIVFEPQSGSQNIIIRGEYRGTINANEKDILIPVNQFTAALVKEHIFDLLKKIIPQ